MARAAFESANGFYDRPNTISTNSPANSGAVRYSGHVYRRQRERVANPYAGRHQPVPADPFNVPRAAQFFPAKCLVQLRPEPEERQAAIVERDLEREIMPAYLVRAAYAGNARDRLR